MTGLNANVSFFERLDEPKRPINNGTFLQIVNSEKLLKKYGALLEKVRVCQDKDERSRLKEKLPIFTPSGTFSQRLASAILQHSGLMVFDIDPAANTWLNADTAPMLRDQIANLPEVAHVALSASGEGVWGVVVIENTNMHKEHFKALQNDFAGFKVIIDKACSDVCRARFWSYDPDAKTNHCPTIYRKLPAPPQAAPYYPHAHSHARPDDLAAQAAEYLINAKAVVAFGYEDYFKLVSACKNAFGDDGQSTAWDILENSPNFLQSNFRKNFPEKWRAAGNRVTGGTLVHIAKQYGFSYAPTQKATDTATRPQEATDTATAKHDNPLPPGFRLERFTTVTGETVETLINADGYPAAWDIEPIQHESLSRAIQGNPRTTDLICRFGLRIDGSPTVADETEQAEWDSSPGRQYAKAILRRANDRKEYVRLMGQNKKASKATKQTHAQHAQN